MDWLRLVLPGICLAAGLYVLKVLKKVTCLVGILLLVALVGFLYAVGILVFD